MVTLSKELIGKKFSPYEFLVERVKVREFCLAIGEKDPIFLDPDAARKAGFEDTPVPPTFQTAFVFWGNPAFMQDMHTLGIDVNRLLHMKEEYKYFKPVYPGMTIQAQMEVSNVKTGRMDMVTFHSIFKNQKGESCIEAEMTIVIPPRENNSTVG